MKRLVLAALVVVLAPSVARADQCAFVTKNQADDAVALIDQGATLVSFCQPCGDKAPETLKVQSVSAAATGFENTWEVSVNGRGIDLAYTFIENGDGKFVNLSKMVDCPSQDVSCLLDAHLAPLPDSCDGAKEDRLDAGQDGGGCNLAARSGSGAAGLLLGLLLIALIRRARA